MRKTTIAALTLGSLLLAGCATTPVGPTVRVMPGPYKPFEVFQRDQFECTGYADGQVAGGAEAANNRAVGAAIIGSRTRLGLGCGDGRRQCRDRGCGRRRRGRRHDRRGHVG